MTTFEFGEVVVIDYTFTNQLGSKPRPAVIISCAEYNAVMPDAVLMPITSQIRERTSFPDLWLEAWEEAGLRKPSAVKPAFITVEKTLFGKRLGRLRVTDRAALRSAVANILAT